MKKNIFNVLILIFCIFILIEVLLNKILIFDTIKYSLDIWINNLVPSLFPFFILSDLLIHYHIIDYFPKKIKKIIGTLFNISDPGVLVFLLSLLSGFPSNARNVRNLYDNHQISKQEAAHILMFTHFSNPLFILGTLSVFFFKNEKLGIIILLTHISSNILVGILTRSKNHPTMTDYITEDKKSQNFGLVLTQAIKKSIDSLLLILGILSCCLVVAAILIQTLSLTGYEKIALKGIIEITMGLKELGTLNLSEPFLIIISSMLLSFGGLSIHMQVLSQIVDVNISYKPFLLGRILQTIFSAILGYFFYIVLY